MEKFTYQNILALQALLKPCPFCGCPVEISICDDEGNFHGSDYLRDPYSGLQFCITHRVNDRCILSSDPDNEEFIGHFMFDDLDELAKAWNIRVS